MLELLKELAPSVTRAAVIRHPFVPAGSGGFASVQTVAPSFGVELTPVGVRDADEIERGIVAFAGGMNNGLIMVGPPSSTMVHRDLIITLAARHRLPAVYPVSSLRNRGRSTLLRARHRRSVSPCRQLCRSHPQGREASRPACAAPTKYELVINLKTAKALGLDVPPIAACPRRRGDRVEKAPGKLVRSAGASPVQVRS